MKTIKICLCTTICLLLCIFVSNSVLFAWNPPNFKNTSYTEKDIEMRAVWVCTVSNMDVSKQNGTSEAAINEWKEKYLNIIDNALNYGLNTIIFQVRPCNDAFYPSKYNPWSEFLVGFGINPGWDPLEWMIEVTHTAGLEYHAWLNPYRASTASLTYSYVQDDPTTGIGYIYDYDESELNEYKDSFFGRLKNVCLQNNTLVDNPIFSEGSALHHNVVLGTEGKFVLNPASENTTELLKNTIEELVTNYELDGIHFDDYFYPNDMGYKGNNSLYKGMDFSTEPIVDVNDYNFYKENGGTLDIYDWRRENVNNLIETLSKSIRQINNNKQGNHKCAFGISPCSRWAPSVESCPVGSHRGAEGGDNGSCNNYYAYSDLYADTRKWALEEWIDYIVPQNYTPLGSSTAGIPTGTYSDVVKWWSDTLANSNVRLFIGTALYQIDSWESKGQASIIEIFYQIKWNDFKNFDVDGYVYFRYDSMIRGKSEKSAANVRNVLWKKTALTPTYAAYSGYGSVLKNTVVTKLLKNNDDSYTINYELVDSAKAYAVMENDKVIARVLSGQDSITFTPTSEDSKISIVTYGYDNKMCDEPVTIDLTTAYINKAPEIKEATILNKNYLCSSKIDLKFVVEDAENDLLTYDLICHDSVNEVDYKLLTNQKTTGLIEYSYECLAMPHKDLQFILIVKDSSHETRYESTMFNIVNKLNLTPPSIIYMEANKNEAFISINYGYIDSDKTVTSAYILVNGEKFNLNSNTATLVIDKLTEPIDFTKNDYTVKLVIEYLDIEENVNMVSSEEIKLEKEEIKEKEEDKKGCKKCGKKNTAAFVMATSSMLISLIFIIKRKEG